MRKLLLGAACALFVAAALGGSLLGYLEYKETSKLKTIAQLIEAKHFSEAVSQAIELYHLDNSNCREIALERLETTDSGGEEVVAQTNFDQVVRIDPARDAFHSANRLVLTLFHEFIHCNQHQRLYEFVRRNNSYLSEHLKPYEKLKAVPIAAESSLAPSASDPKGTKIQEMEERLAQSISPLARYLENAFEIDALVQVFQWEKLMLERSEEFSFHVKYLKAALAREALRKNTKDEKACSFKQDIVDEIASSYERSCIAAFSLVKKYSSNHFEK